jgi:hypothetical protein
MAHRTGGVDQQRDLPSATDHRNTCVVGRSKRELVRTRETLFARVNTNDAEGIEPFDWENPIHLLRSKRETLIGTRSAESHQAGGQLLNNRPNT